MGCTVEEAHQGASTALGASRGRRTGNDGTHSRRAWKPGGIELLFIARRCLEEAAKPSHVAAHCRGVDMTDSAPASWHPDPNRRHEPAVSPRQEGNLMKR